MNLAICIHGIIGGSSGKNGIGKILDVKKLYEHINKRIIKPNKDDFDEINFFIHTWSTDKTDLIKEYFKPKQIQESLVNLIHCLKVYNCVKNILMMMILFYQLDLIVHINMNLKF